jgi:glycosyltransferase involved in cell wall biosynthesis
MSDTNFPKFSVLMPVYIKEAPLNLTEALNSILVDQSIKPDELVIVEDGPLTTELHDVLVKYNNQFSNIVKLFKLDENMGMGYAMNYGLNQCSYDWIFRMDSDDIAVSTRFEKQLKIIQQEEYDVIGSAIEEFNETIGDINQLRIMPQMHPEIIDFMKLRNPINHMTVAFSRKKAIEAGGYWDKRYFEDYNLWYQMYKVGAKFYNIQEPLVYARIGNNMIKRRSGYAYYQYETELMKSFLNDKFINRVEYGIILSVKFILRILPVNVLTLFYKKLLRKRKV